MPGINNLPGPLGVNIAKLSQDKQVNTDLTKRGADLSRGPNINHKLAPAPWSETWPAPGSTVDLDFTNNRSWVRGSGQGGAMDALTYSRASTATYIDANGILQTAGVNEPRFDWANTTNIVTGSDATISTPSNQLSIVPLTTNSTCNGILWEKGYTNYLLWCRDATQSSVWTCTNITPSKDQIGIDGVGNTASSLYATSNNATCIQQVTLSTGWWQSSVYLKRIAGSGAVKISIDNGNTWFTVDLSNGLWNRVAKGARNSNPTLGILIASAGDIIAMDYGQIEIYYYSNLATSPILTTTTPVTRSSDICELSAIKFDPALNLKEHTLLVDFRYLCDSGIYSVVQDIVSIQTPSNSFSDKIKITITLDNIVPSWTSNNIVGGYSNAGQVRPSVTYQGKRYKTAISAADGYFLSATNGIVYPNLNSINKSLPSGYFNGQPSNATNVSLSLNLSKLVISGVSMSVPISRIIYWPKKLTQEALTYLTS